jgi:sarcosine oxidase subunit gamma
VAELHAKPPFDGLLPIRHGSVEAAEWHPGAITSVAPFRGQEAAVSEALASVIGLGLPPVGRWETQGDTTIVWAGLDLWFVLGPEPGPLASTGTTDQSDAWACATLSGAGLDDVLARLTPIDLRETAFPPGHVVRTSLGHMPCILVRLETERVGLMVFRSMAGTAAHELDRAMRMAAVRAARD